MIQNAKLRDIKLVVHQLKVVRRSSIQKRRGVVESGPDGYLSTVGGMSDE